MADSDEILTFWFGSEQQDLAVIQQQGSLWFASDAALDQRIQSRFGEAVELAARGELEDWTRTARGRLAVIILLDQFTRNIYRGTARAFASDELALRYCREGIEAGHDRALRRVERPFLYMPLMHSETLEAQDQALRVFEQLAETADGELRKSFENNVKFARMHRDLIVRYGRFPHRNSILGRENTPAEAEYLAGDAETFGQSKK
ncbi:MAG: DUF924 domain-containing protein [Myxococcales bacterium]|nr:DUF924 domain-containing protein [Myxococcales bacterium]